MHHWAHSLNVIMMLSQWNLSLSSHYLSSLCDRIVLGVPLNVSCWPSRYVFLYYFFLGASPGVKMCILNYPGLPWANIGHLQVSSKVLKHYTSILPSFNPLFSCQTFHLHISLPYSTWLLFLLVTVRFSSFPEVCLHSIKSSQVKWFNGFQEFYRVVQPLPRENCGTFPSLQKDPKCPCQSLSSALPPGSDNH